MLSFTGIRCQFAVVPQHSRITDSLVQSCLGKVRPPVEAHDKKCGGCAGQLSAAVAAVTLHARIR